MFHQWTRELLGNPSPPPNFPRPKKSGRISKVVGFAPRGLRGAKPTGEENLEGEGDEFSNTSQVLVEHGHSLIITREGLMKILPLGIRLVNTASRDRIGQYYPAGRDGHQIHPCGVRLIDSVNFNPSLVMMRECFVFY